MNTIDDLPGPPRRPVVGNLLDLVRTRTPHRLLEGWADDHGLTFRFRPGGQRDVVVTADPVLVDLALRRRPDDFGRDTGMSAVINEIVPHGVFTAEGDRWRRLRKVATQSLNAAYLRQYFTTITKVTERLLRRWEAAAAAGERVDVLDSMMRYTLDVTSGLAMGHDLNSLESTGEGLHRRLPMLFPAFARRINAPFPYWRRFKLPQDHRLDATVREIEALVKERFAHARARVAAGESPANFLEALVKPLENEPGITDEEVFGNVLTMLLAGEDTTSSTAAWALHFLAEHPDIAAKVRAEADEVLGDQRVPGDPATIGRLRYAEAVVHEVLRLQPVAPMAGLQNLRDMTVARSDGRELFLPANTPIVVLTSYGARRDTARFPDAGVFRPERWLDGRLPAEALPFAPFGSGPRFCPGRNLALIEAAMVTSVLGRRFDLAGDRTAGMVHERMSFAAYPVNLHLHVTARRDSRDSANPGSAVR
ncbi:cytochrome P450 [Catenuloplanes indicus]